MATINVSTTAALSTALKAAKAGDTIVLSQGSYTLSASNLKFASEVVVTSADAGRPAVITNLSITGSSGLTLRDLDLSASPTGMESPFQIKASENIRLERLDVHGTVNNDPSDDVSGMLIRGSRNVTVVDSEFHDLADALTHVDSFGLTIARNTFHHLQYDGVRGGGTSNITISGNLFRDFFPKATDHPDAVQFWTTNTTASASNIVITDNAFLRGEGGAAQGIFMRDQVGNLPYENVTVTGNVIAGATYHGISVTAARNVTIDNNIVQGFTGMKSWILLSKVQGATVTNNDANEVIVQLSGNVSQAGNQVIGLATDSGAWAFGQWQPPANDGAGGAGPGAGAVLGQVLTGDAGANTLSGDAGADTIDGRGGADLLTGGPGDDVFIVTPSAKVVEVAGGGVDLIRTGESLSLPANIENLEILGTKTASAGGNELDNIIIGNAGGNYMRGYAGNDTLDGRAGSDMLLGEAGDDRLIGGAGKDTFVFKPGGGSDTVADFSAGDALDASALLLAGARATLTAGAGGVTISFSTGEKIMLSGLGLDDLTATPTGWIFG